MWFANGKYVVSRVLHGIPIILAIVVVNFFLIRLAPGDAVQVLAGETGGASAEYVQQLRERFGLDQPLWVQFLAYMKNLLVFDLGYSFRHNREISGLILDRLGVTALLMAASMVISIGFGVLLGAIAAVKDRTAVSQAIVIMAVITYATPLFWVGLMLIIIFSLNLGWFPTSGYETIGIPMSFGGRVLDIAHHLVLPATTLSFFYMALYTRLMRASMLEVLGQDYVRTARAKGLGDKQVVFRHALRNAIIPVITMAGVQVSAMLGGSVIVESVFGWPGLGLLAYEALFSRDLNLLLGIFFLSSILVVIVNALVDVIYTIIDPRIRLNGGRNG
ncbi:ABC transporter permease [Brucella lupini]|uniref:ABC transporter permease n=1 Tax=Brucella lupini TaxID=255457 RepID=A0A256GZV5_9HYPH|nr:MULTISPECIES: ABC transporter permease [Brucella]KAB2699473.1 ABC transporter permease [Brucella lupini]OYR32672.1 binding-protein-dependent transport system inner membrane component family protein [Brucella lupini]